MQYHAKEEIPSVNTQTQAIFDQGHLVGEFARKLFPDGIEIDCDHSDIGRILELSQVALIHRKPLCEAGFQFEGGFARVDILNPVGKDQWDIIEVKSSTDVKDINLQDLAFQTHVYRGAGLKIRNSILMHINNKYVRTGEIEPAKLFTQIDVTKFVAGLLHSIPSNIKRMQEVIAEKACPDIQIGSHCNDPYECQLQDTCWAFLPEHSVFTLYRIIHKQCFELLSRGILGIQDLPVTYRFSPVQLIQKQAIQTGKQHVDPKQIQSFLRTLQYPLYYLDFETFQTAIPLYNGVRPYQRVPFQFSLHVQADPKSEPVHHGFLTEGKTDPRLEILNQLKTLLGKSGSIVAYSASFEKSVLKEITDFCGRQNWFKGIESRIVDLLVPFRSFHFYGASQRGSNSIKAVYPVLCGKGYQNMEIADGSTASSEYCRVTFGDAKEEERKRVRNNLEAYCQLDTQAMIDIVKRLTELSV